MSLAGVKPLILPLLFCHILHHYHLSERFQRAQLSRRLPLLFTNPYVFLPIVLMPDHRVLPFITCLGFSCTLVFPYPWPRKVWWSVHALFEGYVLAPKGAKGVVLTPTRAGFSATWPLPWDLWVFFQSSRVHPLPFPTKKEITLSSVKTFSAFFLWRILTDFFTMNCKSKSKYIICLLLKC